MLSRASDTGFDICCRELNLSEKFEQLEKESYEELKQLIAEQAEVPEAVFELFLGKIYKRKK